MQQEKKIIIQDNWSSLRQYTNARIALGRTGVSIPSAETLAFKMAHAHARDAVFSLMDNKKISEGCKALQLPFVLLKSNASDRHIYLQRPDFGRRLNEASARELTALKNESYDICISIADGLSAEAINKHAIPLLQLLLEKMNVFRLLVAPVCLIENGRVAISDETGFLLQAKLSLILIGERPGLSSPDSLGVYLTYQPKIGNTDEQRNCVSNIRPEGLGYEEAAKKITYLIRESLRLQLSGVELKDNSSKALDEPV